MGLKISKEHGVNPSVNTCFVCGKEMDVVLFGTAYKDENGKTVEAPTRVCTGELCDECKSVIDDGGIFFIAIKDGDKNKNPWRTGHIGAMKEEAVKRMFPDFKYNKVNYMEESMFHNIFTDA